MSRASLRQVAAVRPQSRTGIRAPLQRPGAALKVLRAAPPAITPRDDDPEASLLAFDPEEDLASLVPMPFSIPGEIRAALAHALARRFEHYEELDAWLHEPHSALGGRSPFEQIVGGDGEGVLRALTGAEDPVHRDGFSEGAGAVLRLVR